MHIRIAVRPGLRCARLLFDTCAASRRTGSVTSPRDDAEGTKRDGPRYPLTICKCVPYKVVRRRYLHTPGFRIQTLLASLAVRVRQSATCCVSSMLCSASTSAPDRMPLPAKCRSIPHQNCRKLRFLTTNISTIKLARNYI